jgi:TolC family type I secretion outer membrane protein
VSRWQTTALGRRLTVATALALIWWCQPLRADTLNEGLVAAYLSNPDLEAARAEQRANDELVPQALSGWRPQVFAGGGLQRQWGQTDVGDLDLTTKSTSLTVSQSLYAGGATVANTSRAENLVSAGRAQLVATEEQVLLNSVTSYVAAWRDRAVLDLALNNEQRLRRQLQATQDRFQVGEVARTDDAQAEASLAGARSDVEVAKANLAASNATYRQVIGKDPVKLTDPTPLKRLPATLDQSQAIAQSNPSITAASFQLFAARDNVDVAFANLLPSLDLQGQLEYADDPQVSLSWERRATIGLNLSVPLYQGGAEYSRVRQNRQIAQQRRKDLESSNRSVQASVTTAWEGLLAATAAIESLKAEVKANDIALEGVQQEALVGSRTVLDVLDAEQALFVSQVNLVRARASEVTASYQLKSAVGELTVMALDLPVDPYNPELYYNAVRNRLFGIDDYTG